MNHSTKPDGAPGAGQSRSPDAVWERFEALMAARAGFGDAVPYPAGRPTRRARAAPTRAEDARVPTDAAPPAELARNVSPPVAAAPAPGRPRRLPGAALGALLALAAMLAAVALLDTRSRELSTPKVEPLAALALPMQAAGAVIAGFSRPAAKRKGMETQDAPEVAGEGQVTDASQPIALRIT